MCGFAAYMNINASLAMMIGSILPLVTALLSRIFLAIKI
jgi:drug/metabolite transporter (DMT)-like permease